MASLPKPLEDWFAARGWRPRSHQLAMLEAARPGRHTLLVAATGAGKTLSGFLPVLADAAEKGPRPGLKALYVSPLKALAADVERNLATPIREAGLPLGVETRTGDTSSEAKRRQRQRPPDILLTTPESLSLLLTWPEAERLFADLETLIIDEIHAFATSKRGDLLALAAARLRTLAPRLRLVGLSATIADPPAMANWLAPGAEVEIVRGAEAVPPDISILVPRGEIPWAGHNGRHAAREVMELLEEARQSIVFANTRSIAELLFRDLWTENDKALPIGLHHGSLSAEARLKAEAALVSGRLKAVVATSSLDLGIDWGDVDLVVQMGAPKGAARLLQRVGRSNHRLDEASRAVIVPGNRFEYLEALACLDAVAEGELDAEPHRPGGLDVLAQHIMGIACAGPFEAGSLYAEIRLAAPYAGLSRDSFDRALAFVATGGYALSGYDRYRRLVEEAPGRFRLTHPKLAQQHRLNAGVIVEAPAMTVRLGRGRALGQVEEWFATQLRLGDRFLFAGLTLELTGRSETDLYTRLARGAPSVPSYEGGRMPLSTHLARRVRGMLADPAQWRRMPADVRDWLEMQRRHSRLPPADKLLAESFPREGRHHLLLYGFEGRNAHQSLGMLLTQRMEKRGLKPMGFVATDYVLGVWGLEPVEDPASLFAGDIVAEELEEWIGATPFLRRAFRDVAIISGLVERQRPGARKTGRQMTVSTDLIYDVLQRHEPGHLLLEAAWAEASSRLTDIARLHALIARAREELVVSRLERPSPLSIPILIEIGAEGVSGMGEAELLAELLRDDREV
ncbi:ligase-associated DNA damage response DEXH box helicase [Sandaracinobacter sp. RS1-74]|uniref:ligase-associated DNA damage response DEXH box helicase n=1 Tax=Sandaracinobacteroides sayramensis TaxID=2913411 RepID=UPI001EDBC7B3|nr:ligase-associated DNA damage response DEXH box helicase [Sandaracinobacteroides sayramensis]MCG2840454.1 ligase-associated DNA damage response DEXH box helicase [Sandaracinobacteroides sayramensis]